MCPSPLPSPPLGERVAEGRVRGRGKVPRRTKLAPGFLRSNRGTGGFTSPRRWKRHCAAGGRDEIQLMRFSKRTEQRDQKKERSSRQNRRRDQDRSAPTYLRGTERRAYALAGMCAFADATAQADARPRRRWLGRGGLSG